MKMLSFFLSLSVDLVYLMENLIARKLIRKQFHCTHDVGYIKQRKREKQRNGILCEKSYGDLSQLQGTHYRLSICTRKNEDRITQSQLTKKERQTSFNLFIVMDVFHNRFLLFEEEVVSLTFSRYDRVFFSFERQVCLLQFCSVIPSFYVSVWVFLSFR